jgi:hypothetical protein
VDSKGERLLADFQFFKSFIYTCFLHKNARKYLLLSDNTIGTCYGIHKEDKLVLKHNLVKVTIPWETRVQVTATGNLKEERHFLPGLKARVSVPSKG